jgi:hypothetical protein
MTMAGLVTLTDPVRTADSAADTVAADSAAADTVAAADLAAAAASDATGLSVDSRGEREQP